MSKQHTPGPWIVIERRHPYNDGNKSHIERGIYTQEIQPQLKDHWPVVCMSVGIGMTGAMPIPFVNIREGDARLIAAAPELLEALQKALPMVAAAYSQGFVDAEIVGKDMEAAIAKATGGAA